MRRLPPELYLFGIGFLLHLPWEVCLSVLTREPDVHLIASGEMPLAIVLGAISRAGLGVVAYWIVAGLGCSRDWVETGGSDDVRLFLVASFVVTMVMEILAPGRMTDWRHAASLTTFATPGQALLALLQVITVPLALVWVVGRLQRRASGDITKKRRPSEKA